MKFRMIFVAYLLAWAHINSQLGTHTHLNLHWLKLGKYDTPLTQVKGNGNDIYLHSIAD